MPKLSAKRAALLAELDSTLRKISAQSVLLSDAVSTLIGLNSTELECLDLLYLSGATTAGRLARHTGLTTGAMTAVIDRLERGGLVSRRRDARDRRVVLVEALPCSISTITPLYQRLIDAMATLNASYTDRQLAVVVDYLSKAVGLGADHVAWLQTQSPMPRSAAGRRLRGRRASAHAAAEGSQPRAS